MLRFVAYAWKTADCTQSSVARLMRKKASEDSNLIRVFDEEGLTVFACGFQERVICCHLLHRHAGVVLGTLFYRPEESDTSVLVTALDAERSALIVETAGRDLVRNYWGRYVAIIRRATGETWVLQNPAAGMPVYRATVSGVAVYFSELVDCIRVTGARFCINWEYIAAHAARPIFQTRSTALSGIEEVLGGECDEIRGGDIKTLTYWNLAAFATSRLESPTDASNRLRATVKDCVHAWASLYPKILLEYSGGLDSSIVLSCLRDAPTSPQITCVTHYGYGPGVDERKYARIGVEAAGCRWIEHRVNELGSFSTFEQVVPSPRPNIYLRCLNDRELATLAQDVSAGVIANGEGGDAVFFEVRDIRVASDYVQDHKFGRAFGQVMSSTAMLTQAAVGQVVVHAIGSMLRAPQAVSPIVESVRHKKLLTKSAVAQVLAQPNRFAHSSTNAAGRLPRAKALHIYMMSQMLALRPPLTQGSQPEYGQWLTSQPILELVARMPTYLLTHHGRTRSVARDAFVGDVPQALLDRTSKGYPDSYIRTLVRHNRSFAAAYLQGGKLVARGVLDAEKVDLAMSGRATDVNAWEVMCHLSTEVWLKQIDDAQKARVSV